MPEAQRGQVFDYTPALPLKKERSRKRMKREVGKEREEVLGTEMEQIISHTCVIMSKRTPLLFINTMYE